MLTFFAHREHIFCSPLASHRSHGSVVDNVIKELTINKIKIKYGCTSRYHPRANGQTQNTNRIMFKIITKMAEDAMTNWDSKLLDTLWAYCNTYKVTSKFRF